ncbi:MAG: hypothetical protein V8Q30_10850 [Acutalibacteraceae bacterium]
MQIENGDQIACIFADELRANSRSLSSPSPPSSTSIPSSSWVFRAGQSRRRQHQPDSDANSLLNRNL